MTQRAIHVGGIVVRVAARKSLFFSPSSYSKFPTKKEKEKSKGEENCRVIFFDRHAGCALDV